MASQRIRELPERERPREKLAASGPAALSDGELIAILLRTGVAGKNAVEVAQELLSKFGSLAGLARCDVRQLAAIKGVGPAKAVQLAAAFALGARLARETVSRSQVDTAALVYELLGAEMRALDKESLRVLLLDTRLRLKHSEEVSLGSVNESIAHPREIFRPAIVHSAYGIILAHNHPSGDPSPSEADRRLTRRVAEAGVLLQIKLIDHIIIGSPETGRLPYYSFREGGLL